MKLVRETDTLLLVATLLTVALGITTIYSATFHSEALMWMKQMRFALVAVVIALAIVYLPNKILYGLSYTLYLLGFMSLVAVQVWGTGEGAAR